MKRILFFVFAVLISVAFISTSFAQTTEKSGTTEKAEKKSSATKAKTEKAVSVTGEVVKNDGKRLTLKAPEGEKQFNVSGVKNAKKYKEGETVIIKYKEKNGKLTASSIKKPLFKGKTSKSEVEEKAEKPKAESK